jgi:gas vesicle protein
MAGKNQTVKKVAIGAALAGVAGYVAGILTAPKSGKETRTDIKNVSVQTKAEAEKQLKKLHTQLATILNDAKAEAEQLKGKARKDLDASIEKARVAREKAREILSALHEGDADDKDLKKAIQEAQVALTHLKSYLKKAA